MRGILSAWSIDLPCARWDLRLTDAHGEQWGLILLPELWATQAGRRLWATLTTLACEGIEVDLIGEERRDAYGGAFIVTGIVGEAA